MFRPLTIMAAKELLYGLRADGAVFVLMTRGAPLPDGTVARDPFWAACPAIPGTEAAAAQEG